MGMMFALGVFAGWCIGWQMGLRDRQWAQSVHDRVTREITRRRGRQFDVIDGNTGR